MKYVKTFNEMFSQAESEQRSLIKYSVEAEKDLHPKYGFHTNRVQDYNDFSIGDRVYINPKFDDTFDKKTSYEIVKIGKGKVALYNSIKQFKKIPITEISKKEYK